MTATNEGFAGFADRYASALFELAEADKAVEVVADELQRLDAMIRENADLRRLIRSPVISREQQSQAMAALLQKAEMSALTRRFVGLVAYNRRLFALPNMIAAYRNILASRRGETTAEVVSAKALTAPQLAAITNALKKAVGTNVVLSTRTDPGLLGGLVVQVGSRMVDSSLRTKLKRLQLAMKGIG